MVGEVHDLADDLMKQVILRGGQLALVCDGERAKPRPDRPDQSVPSARWG